MNYFPPINDIKFSLRYLADIEKVAALTPFSEISFDLAETIIEEAGKLAANIIAPLNHKADVASARFNDDGTVSTPDGFAEAYRAMAEGGWTSMEAQEAYGGQNMPMVLNAAVNEMWQSASLSFALCHLLTQGQIYALQKAASEEQKRVFLPPMVEGRWTGTMNLTEPQAGTDLSSIKTRAMLNGDHYLISGQKIYITYGEHDMAENIVHLVLARTLDAPKGVKGISVFIVPKFLVNEDGSLGVRNDVRCLSIEKKLGIKASPTAIMQYGENGGAVGYLIGEENQGLAVMFSMMNHARFNVGLQGLSIAERGYQQAVDYANTRIQGIPIERSSGTPISHHPDVLRLLSVMRAEIEAMRGLILVGGAALDEAQYGDEAVRPKFDERASLLIPLIKGWITERSVSLTSDAVQVHGGMGFMEETGAAQHYRDARILPIYEGTTAIQANDLIFRKTLRDNGAAVRELLADIELDMSDIPDDLSQPVMNAILITRQTLDNLCVSANDPRLVAAGSVHWLMMLGYLCGGWLMAKSGNIADNYKSKEFSDQFIAAKKVTSRIYLTQCLPEIYSLAQKIIAGGIPVLSMDPSWLSRD
ncbi:MAG: acyl-CoA dehydrogenase [Paracoccaceae bacterium]|jgi:alkylation response protein AidB-like acyl-CoA dehydrogenase